MERKNLFDNMEIEVIQTILRDHPSLLNQLKNVTVIKREFTGVGFYTDFYVDGDVTCGEDIQISNVGGNINNVHVGFLLFITKGKIDFLEGYTYNSNPFPEIIESYEIFIENYGEMK